MSLDAIRSAASELAAVINAAAKDLDNVGVAELASAEANLARATADALARLQAAADRVRATLGGLPGRIGGIVTALVSDLNRPATKEAEPQQPPPEAPTASKPVELSKDAVVPDDAPTAGQIAEVKAELDAIGRGEFAVTDRVLPLPAVRTTVKGSEVKPDGASAAVNGHAPATRRRRGEQP